MLVADESVELRTYWCSDPECGRPWLHAAASSFRDDTCPFCGEHDPYTENPDEPAEG
jgi:hypothetical protein